MVTFFDKIVFELLEHPYFKSFKFRKRDSTLIKNTKYGRQFIELRHWTSGNTTLVILPQYLVRFNILCKWFERYSFKTLQDQRDGWFIGFNGRMLNEQDTFNFLYNERDINYKNELKNLTKNIITCSEYVFDEYSTLEKTYQKEILPILDGCKKLPNVGADWFFENLTLCRIISPEQYEKLKEIQLEHAKEMFERKEPNISAYYQKIPEILSYLEGLELHI